ncbi:hypothetical protein ASA_2513 [Aeromonas salmonicida subsp. salmonicida A449]|uniref:Uncharacterized protein n=1 Tax=Aeromonas salmonicida (strain A449) TaxID=382245 RepID=A4SNS2_AERS4|nr:hypothetical protein ASA_2513 [Aeromonas salmonicida subsp. salmonicida A449]
MKSTFIASVTGIMSHGTEYQRAHDGHLLFAIFPHQYPKGQALYSTLLISFPEAAGRPKLRSLAVSPIHPGGQHGHTDKGTFLTHHSHFSHMPCHSCRLAKGFARVTLLRLGSNE